MSLRIVNKLWIIISAGLFITSCTESVTESDLRVNPITVNIRIEVQVLDSLNHIYSRPFTKIYFTTYKLHGDGTKTNFGQSDTTSCANGWGVKELIFILNQVDEKIMLGAASENYDGNNLRFEEITYAQALYQSDSLQVAYMKRTFPIYYK